MKVRCIECGEVLEVEDVCIWGEKLMSVAGSFGSGIEDNWDHESITLSVVGCPYCGAEAELSPEIEVPPVLGPGGIVLGYDLDVAMEKFAQRVKDGKVELFEAA